MKKFKLTQPEKSICCYSNYGPVFGGGHDIKVFNECNKNESSYFDFPFSYNDGSYTAGEQIGKTVMSGNPSGKNCKIV